jgi:hypothetical protein
VFVDGREVHGRDAGGATINGEYRDLTDRPETDDEPDRRLPQ